MTSRRNLSIVVRLPPITPALYTPVMFVTVFTSLRCRPCVPKHSFMRSFIHPWVGELC